jgi:hypothetical protein
METALIAAGAAILGTLVAGGLAIMQATLNARVQAEQANRMADREEHQRRYEHKATVFAEYLAASLHIANVISEASEKRAEIQAEMRRSNPSAGSEDLTEMVTGKVMQESTAAPEWKRWQALGMQVRLLIEPEEEKALADFEDRTILESAKMGLRGDRTVTVRSSPLLQVMRDHLSRHATASSGRGVDVTAELAKDPAALIRQRAVCPDPSADST